MKVPCSSSSKARSSSACVLITMGPAHAIGSPMGLPETTVEGAGVHLHRAIGIGPPEEYDPFLLLDDFRAARS